MFWALNNWAVTNLALLQLTSVFVFVRSTAFPWYRTSHWRQPHRGCREHIPTNILVGGAVIGKIPSPILLRTFGYSRPVLVVLAQRQRLVMSFLHCFARKSSLRELTIKTLNLAPQNSPKHAILRSQNEKNCSPRLLPRWGGEHPLLMGHTPNPFRRFPPH